MAKLHNVGAFNEKHLQVTVHHSGQVGLGIEDTRHSGRSIFVALSPSEAGWLREQIAVEEKDNPEEGEVQDDGGRPERRTPADEAREALLEIAVDTSIQPSQRIEAARAVLHADHS